MNFWDQSYTSVEGFKYGESPNAFLQEQAYRLASGSRILVPGDGEGRNGVWLARQGHSVLSVDGSEVGLARARELATRNGVTLELQHADLAAWEPEPASVDAVVMIYLHLPPAVRPLVHAKLKQALKPGGLLLLETFHPRQLQNSSGGPKDAAMLYTLEMLRADFGAGMEELLAEEGPARLDEGSGHQGPAWVTRLIARKSLT